MSANWQDYLVALSYSRGSKLTLWARFETRSWNWQSLCFVSITVIMNLAPSGGTPKQAFA